MLLRLNKASQWFSAIVLSCTLAAPAGADIVIDNPFLPWEIAGTDNCNQLWRPDVQKVKLGDYAIIEDSFNLTRTVVEAVSITNLTAQIRWSVSQTGTPDAAAKNDYIIYSHDRRTGAILQTATGNGRVQQRDPRVTVTCQKGPLNVVALRLGNKTWDAEFFRFTAFTQQNAGDVSTVDQVFVWTTRNATPLFSVLQISQTYPNLVCVNGSNGDQTCTADLYLKTTKLVEYGNRAQ